MRSTSEVLIEALKRLGPNGEHWIKGIAYDNKGGMCSVGAIGNSPEAWRQLDKYAPRGMTAAYNDAPSTTFVDIKRMFCAAIKEALEQETKDESGTNAI